jgi:hypothetical protein
VAGDKTVGMGQGDNWRCFKSKYTVHANLYRKKSENTLFIYTTPDEGEEELFEDHLSSITSLNPQWYM